MFSLICTQINGWVNNDEAGDLRRHCAHYDVSVMEHIHFQLLQDASLSCFCWQALGWVLFECILEKMSYLNTLRSRQNGRHFPEDIFKWIFLNENVWISIKNSLKFVPRGTINNIPALVQIMAWRRPGDKPLSEPMVVSLLMHICVTRPQWVSKFQLKYSTSQEICTWHMLCCILLWCGTGHFHSYPSGLSHWH